MMKGIECMWAPDNSVVLVYDHCRQQTIFYGTAQEFSAWALVEKYGDGVMSTVKEALLGVTKPGSDVMSDNEAELLCGIRVGEVE